jgi:hypothetical protein
LGAQLGGAFRAGHRRDRPHGPADRWHGAPGRRGRARERVGRGLGLGLARAAAPPPPRIVTVRASPQLERPATVVVRWLATIVLRWLAPGPGRAAPVTRGHWRGIGARPGQPEAIAVGTRSPVRRARSGVRSCLADGRAHRAEAHKDRSARRRDLAAHVLDGCASARRPAGHSLGSTVSRSAAGRPSASATARFTTCPPSVLTPSASAESRRTASATPSRASSAR